MITKVGKAHWDYYCDPCGVTVCSVDQFGAIEAKAKHEGEVSHIFHPLVDAVNRIGKGFAAMAQAFNEAVVKSSHGRKNG